MTKVVNRKDERVKRVYVDFVDSFYDPKKFGFSTNDIWVTRKVHRQISSYTKSLRDKKANDQSQLYYSMLSTIEVN